MVNKPFVQYLLAFVSGYVVIFISGLLLALTPRFVLGTVADAIVSALLVVVYYALGFWLFGRALGKWGVKHLKARALWFGTIFAALLLIVAFTSDLTLYLAYSRGTDYLRPVLILGNGLFFVAAWWLVRRQSAIK